MHWDQLLPSISELLVSHPPQFLVIHLGENDLGQRSTMSLRLQACKDFYQVDPKHQNVMVLSAPMQGLEVYALTGQD